MYVVDVDVDVEVVLAGGEEEVEEKKVEET